MGKKRSWFSAIKRIFTCNAKKKPAYGSVKKNSKEKKKGRRILRHGEIKSFLFREPSSIEKILGEVDEQNLLIKPPTSEQCGTSSAFPVRSTSSRANSPTAKSPRITSSTAASPKATSPRAVSPRIASPRETSLKAASPRAEASPKAASLKAASPKSVSPRAASPRDSSPVASHPELSRNLKEIAYANRSEPSLTLHLSATKIQAAYRRHLARKNFRSSSSRGLARLQRLVRSSNVKRQTVNAMRQMQFLVRVQMQIKSRRTQMFENQALQSEAYGNDREVESTLSKCSQLTETGIRVHWDNSVLSKDDVDARRREKVEATIKRERAMTYAYSHQLSKSNTKSVVDIRASRIPWWWNWSKHEVPPGNDSDNQSASKNVLLTPQGRISASPWRHNLRHLHSDFDNHESVTPRSAKSAIPVRGIQMHTPRRTSPMSSSSISNFSRRRATNSPFSHFLKDDDSLTSCPPFSGPNYMSPTISAKAKFIEKRNLEENTPSNSSRRRLSFPLTPNSTGSFKWNRGSAASSMRDHESPGDHMSVDSTVSMPAIVGRKPFKRFV